MHIFSVPVNKVNTVRIVQITITITYSKCMHTDVVFELEQLVYDTTEGGIPMVMVCVNLSSGILVSRSITVEVAPKPADPQVDTATSKTGNVSESGSPIVWNMQHTNDTLGLDSRLY